MLVTYLYNWSNRNDDTDELFEWFQQIAVGVLVLVSSCKLCNVQQIDTSYIIYFHHSVVRIINI